MTTLINFNAPLKRNLRRGLVVFMLVLFALYLGLGLYGDRLGFQGLLIILLYWLLYVRLAFSTTLFRGKPFFRRKRNKKLDERQQSLRNQAYYLAYLVAVPLAIISYVLVEFFRVRAYGVVYYGTDFISFVLYANLSLVISLPVLYVAWLEPDPITDEETTNDARALQSKPSEN